MLTPALWLRLTWSMVTALMVPPLWAVTAGPARSRSLMIMVTVELGMSVQVEPSADSCRQYHHDNCSLPSGVGIGSSSEQTPVSCS